MRRSWMELMRQISKICCWMRRTRNNFVKSSTVKPKQENNGRRDNQDLQEDKERQCKLNKDASWRRKEGIKRRFKNRKLLQNKITPE